MINKNNNNLLEINQYLYKLTYTHHGSWTCVWICVKQILEKFMFSLNPPLSLFVMKIFTFHNFLRLFCFWNSNWKQHWKIVSRKPVGMLLWKKTLTHTHKLLNRNFKKKKSIKILTCRRLQFVLFIYLRCFTNTIAWVHLDLLEKNNNP